MKLDDDEDMEDEDKPNSKQDKEKEESSDDEAAKKQQQESGLSIDDFKKLRIPDSVMKDGMIFIWVEKEYIY